MDTFVNKGYGGYGNDKLYGSDGIDFLHGDTLDPTPFGNPIMNMPGSIADPEDLTGGQDWIKGYGGDDMIYGGFNDDKIEGGDGDDLLAGEIGNDKIFGGIGDDVIFGDDVVGSDFV